MRRHGAPRPARLVLALVLALVVTACADDDDRQADAAAGPAPEAPAEPPIDDLDGQGEEEPVGEDAPEGLGGPARTEADGEDPAGGHEAAADPADVGANELGLVPVLMYHRLLDDGGGVYDLTPEQFRDELERLYEEGYRPVRMQDVVRGEIDVPAGKSPVVLTFDDSTREQAALDGGDIAADTAIGILLAFAEERPGFEPVASLYLNAHPFGGGSDSDEIVGRLHELGFELGNHTHGHQRLDHLGADEVRRELAQGKEAITVLVPEAEVVTMALPLGIWSDPRELVYEGEWGQTEYRHEGILLVGAEPAPSPFHTDFDPMAIPRIRSGPWDGGEPDYASGFWLDWLADNPERRYVSDGDPSRISFPAVLADDLAPAHVERANPYDPHD